MSLKSLTKSAILKAESLIKKFPGVSVIKLGISTLLVKKNKQKDLIKVLNQKNKTFKSKGTIDNYNVVDVEPSSPKK